MKNIFLVFMLCVGILPFSKALSQSSSDIDRARALLAEAYELLGTTQTTPKVNEFVGEGNAYIVRREECVKGSRNEKIIAAVKEAKMASENQCLRNFAKHECQNKYYRTELLEFEYYNASACRVLSTVILRF